MESKHFILAGLYIGPFLVAAFMPGWRVLGAVAAACGLFWLWLFFVKENETGGISLTVEKILFWLVFFGACAGVVTRAMTLFMQQSAFPIWSLVIVSVLGALAPPAVLFAVGLLK